jgi:hypothetical protein
MTKTFTYDISNYDISTALKTKEDQFGSFYYSGHHEFMIPDFSNSTCDIWLSFLNFLEKENNKEVYDQDGGEIIENEILDINTGYSRCVYEALFINFDEDEPRKDYQVEVFGYIILDKSSGEDNYYFLAAGVNIKISNGDSKPYIQ